MSAEETAPDLFDPALECGAWIKAPSVIGGPTHTHVCRRVAEHTDTDDVEQIYAHHCSCGYTW